MYSILFYDLVDDYVERRGQFRAEHLGLANEAHERGEILLAGAHGDPIDGATLVFTVDDPAVAERFAKNDPYVKNGLVTNWWVVPWHVVVGGASNAT